MVLYVGRGNVNRERKPQGVHQEVALSPLDVLVAIVTAWVSRVFDGFDALGINDSRPRLGIPGCSLPLGRSQGFEDEGPQSVQSVSPEVVVNGRPRRKIMGQKPPMTATFKYIEDGVEDVAQGVAARSSLAFWGG